MYDWVLVSHFWVPQPDSLSEISLILLPALATCPTFTWMLALFKCWKCGCSEWNAATLRVLRVCVWGVLEFVSSLFVEGWYVHHSNGKVQKSLRNSFICRLPQHLCSNVEPRVAGCCYVWEWTVPSVIFCGWDLVTFKKNGDLAKDGKVCQLAVGGYVSAVPLVKVRKVK